MMKVFRFGIMGAGSIAHKFCDAVKHIPQCELVAVSSKSLDRAQGFASQEGIEKAYDSYEMMLQEEQLDGVYIAVTVDAHYDLCMLSMDYKVPILCEKAMFPTAREAEEVFQRAKRENIFIMEGMWSRFLPAIQTARRWILDGKIGEIAYGDVTIGFQAPYDPDNRYWNPKLGGGAALDLTVYSYELLTYMIDQPILDMKVSATWSETGVDTTDQITLQYDNALASIMATLACSMEEHLIIYGSKGRVVVPRPIFADKALLYDNKQLIESFEDSTTINGFTYEIEEMIRCINEGLIESPTVTHQLTIDCCRLYDRIWLTKP